MRTICIDWYIICQHQKGLNHSGSGERMSGRWCSLEKIWQKTQKITRYQHTHTQREGDGVWWALRGLIRVGLGDDEAHSWIALFS